MDERLEAADYTARMQRYQPLKDAADGYRWSPETFDAEIRDYNTRDIAI